MSSSIRLRPGAKLGPYRIEALLGEGPMGRVYRVHDSRLGRVVALKVLPEEFLNQPGRLSRAAEEAAAASELNCPNIATVYEVGEQVLSHSGQFARDGSSSGSSAGTSVKTIPFVAMEYAPGRTLRQMIEAGPVPAGQAIAIAVQAADGMARAHEAGLLHRHLKPENIVFTEEGFVKILDFGLAQAISAPRTATSLDSPRDGILVVGKASCLSPEQVRGETPDARSDIFSLGCILYELLAGRSPFAGGSAVDTLSAILQRNPEPIAELAPAVPASLASVIARCLAKDRAERFASMRSLLSELKSIRRQTAPRGFSGPAASAGARRWRPLRTLLAAGAAGLILAGAALYARWKMAAPPIVETVVTRSGRASAPAISPDAAMIVFVEQGQPARLVAQRLGGGASVDINTEGLSPSDPVFSADGASIYFSGSISGASARSIFRSEVAGGQPARLCPGFRPVPSPDGSRLAFLREAARDQPGLELCVATPDGDSPRCGAVAPDEENDLLYAWKADSAGLLLARRSAHSAGSEIGTFDIPTARIVFRQPAVDTLPVAVNGVTLNRATGDLYFTDSAAGPRGGDFGCRHSGRVAMLTRGKRGYLGVSIDSAGTTAVTARIDRGQSDIVRLSPLRGLTLSEFLGLSAIADAK